MHVDFALVSVFLFFTFFVSLILYLRREDRREGYPLEEDSSGRRRTNGGFIFTALPKTFRMPDGGAVTVPTPKQEAPSSASRRLSVVPGSPSVPTGNPMVDGVGPAAYAERARVPDMTPHGETKIAPMRLAPGFVIAKGDPDPRGMPVHGTDGEKAGVVKEVWVDRPEAMIRYLEVALGGPSGESVMLPMTMAKVRRNRGDIFVDAITAAQFSGVPRLADPNQITFYEEERVTAYYGGGFLYATPQRQEPIL